MRTVALVGLIFLLAGCTAASDDSNSYNSPGGNSYVPPQHVAVKHTLASSSPLAVSAQDTAAHPFSVSSGSVEVQYTFRVTDDSALNVAIIAASDLAEMREGQQVEGWAVVNNSRGTTQTVTLGAGEYDLAFQCRNTFADCDLEYSLYATY